MRSKDSTKQGTKHKSGHSRDDSFHLYSILLVIALTLLSWGVETLSAKQSTSSSEDLLVFLNAISENQIGQVVVGGEEVELSTSNNLPPHHIDEAPKVILSKNYKYTFERLHKKSLTPSSHSIDLNSIDSTTLESLPVLGPVLSARTIKFRDALGGFIEVRQLQDVFGFTLEDYDRVEEWFFVNQVDIIPMCINSATWKEMRSQPYIGAQGATIIERYRRHNELQNLEQLRSLPNMSDSTWTRWKPYIKICSEE